MHIVSIIDLLMYTHFLSTKGTNISQLTKLLIIPCDKNRDTYLGAKCQSTTFYKG
jgi:hypothetical protein